MKVLRHADRIPQRWRNGGGMTEEVAAEHVDGRLLWRVSIATITQDGAFSDFPGIDRMLMPLGEAGLTLEVDGARRHAARHTVVEFAGESAVAAVAVREPGQDLNLMVDRAHAEGALSHIAVDGREQVGMPDSLVLAVCLGGRLTCGPIDLEIHDAVLLEAGESASVHGVGELAVAQVTRLPR